MNKYVSIETSIIKLVATLNVILMHYSAQIKCLNDLTKISDLTNWLNQKMVGIYENRGWVLIGGGGGGWVLIGGAWVVVRVCKDHIQKMMVWTSMCTKLLLWQR